MTAEVLAYDPHKNIAYLNDKTTVRMPPKEAFDQKRTPIKRFGDVVFLEADDANISARLDNVRVAGTQVMVGENTRFTVSAQLAHRLDRLKMCHPPSTTNDCPPPKKPDEADMLVTKVIGNHVYLEDGSIEKRTPQLEGLLETGNYVELYGNYYHHSLVEGVHFSYPSDCHDDPEVAFVWADGDLVAVAPQKGREIESALV